MRYKPPQCICLRLEKPWLGLGTMTAVFAARGPITGREFRAIIYGLLTAESLFDAPQRDLSKNSNQLTGWYDVLGASVKVQCEITFGVKSNHPVIEFTCELQHPLNQLSVSQWGALQNFTARAVDLQHHLEQLGDAQEITDHHDLQLNWSK
jgi:hypothetical protein